MLGRVSYPGLFFQIDAPTGSYDDLNVRQRVRGPSLDYRKIEKLELDPRFMRVAARRILSSDDASRAGYIPEPDHCPLSRRSLREERRRRGSELPWHLRTRGCSGDLDRDPSLQIWTALDDAEEAAGCVDVLPGSHLGGARDAARRGASCRRSS